MQPKGASPPLLRLRNMRRKKMNQYKHCGHRNIIGDNYGETCQDCGEVLSGYGYWAEGSWECKHRFLPVGDDNNITTCVYCGVEKINKENTIINKNKV